MLWNWYTVDACMCRDPASLLSSADRSPGFISSEWHVRSNGAFAGSCIGVILLVVVLELLRRLGREYDEWILRGFAARFQNSSQATSNGEYGRAKLVAGRAVVFRATVLQQLTRAVIHAVTFGVAYIIMLLAMYYNGYIIICIFIGAGLGKFACDWLVRAGGDNDTAAMDSDPCQTTVCCG